MIASLKKESQKMTKPSEVTVSVQVQNVDAFASAINEASKAIQDFSVVMKPSTVTVAKKQLRKSEPVRNPAFREHEGLRALQMQLNSRPARKSK